MKPETTSVDVSAAFRSSRRVQKTWAESPFSQRREIFLRFHNLVLAHRKELLDLIQEETGKARRSAFDEVLDVVVTARHYAFRAERLMRPKRAKGAVPLLTATQVQRAPVGVVGMITPWNYPFSLAISDAIPALLAGNAVVLKPDEKTPRTALFAHQLLLEAGLPEGLLHVVPGAGPVVGQQIVAECDYLMFTGSTETGRLLASQAGERLIGYSAELGGKNPLIVCPDAEVERAARGAVAACFSNTGQLCISIERIYVHEDIAERFIARFVELTTALRLGYGWEDEVGSLISEEHLGKVAGMVDDAVAKGATVLTGARPLPEIGPRFYAPTVLIDVPPTALLHTEEVFGPVVYIERVRSLDEAVERANATEYGLNASVWGKESTAMKVASRIAAGTVNVNEGYAAAWGSLDAPMGGWKSSGLGRRHADEGLLKFTESRTVSAQRLVPLSGNGEQFAEVMSTALRLGKRILR